MPISEGLLQNLKINPSIAKTLTALDMADDDITSELIIKHINNFTELKYISLQAKALNNTAIKAILNHDKLEKVVVLDEELLNVDLELLYNMYRHLNANNKKNAAQKRIEQTLFFKDASSESLSQLLPKLTTHKNPIALMPKNQINQEHYNGLEEGNPSFSINSPA